MFKSFKNIQLSATEKRTFKLHFIFSIIDGIILGALALNEFILIKSLKGTNFQLVLLVLSGVVVLTFSIVMNELLQRTKNRKKMVRIVGLVTRFPLIFFYFFPNSLLDVTFIHQIIFLIIFIIYFSANPILYPVINQLLKDSYSQKNFGHMYGIAGSANKIVMLLITFGFGFWLDLDNFSFRYLYPIMGILSIFSIYILTKINFVEIQNVYRHTLKNSTKKSFKRMKKILNENKPYKDFETSFMLYGFAWLISAAVITLFLENKLNLNYSSIGFYKTVYNTIAIILMPFFGKLLSNIDPRKFGIYTFGSMMLFMLFMALTEYLPFYFTIFNLKIYYLLVLSYVFYGIFAATMALLWYIGSAYFCKNDEVANYQAIHLTLTGVRGIFAPFLGILCLNLFGYIGVFIIGILFLAFSIIVLVKSMKLRKIEV